MAIGGLRCINACDCLMISRQGNDASNTSLFAAPAITLDKHTFAKN